MPGRRRCPGPLDEKAFHALAAADEADVVHRNRAEPLDHAPVDEAERARAVVREGLRGTG